MKSARFVKYDFIPSDEKHLENTGMCVVDQISKIYGPLDSKLSRENFIAEVKEEERVCRCGEEWNMEDGVRVQTLNTILTKHNRQCLFSSITHIICL